jgi:hypothetical protein
MKSRGIWIGVGLLVAVLAFVLWPGDQRLPKPVRQAIRKRFPSAQVIEAKERTRDGRPSIRCPWFRPAEGPT